MTRYGLILIALLLSIVSSQVRAEEQRPSALPWLKLDDLSATRERPLFAPARRPPPPPFQPQAANPEDHPPEAPAMVLMGIIVKESETLVLLRNPATSETTTVRSGDSFGPWRVWAQNDHSAILSNGTKQIALELFAEP
jgi:hypothetical protein